MDYSAHSPMAQCILFAVVGQLLYSAFSSVFNKEESNNNILFFFNMEKVVANERTPEKFPKYNCF